MKLLVGLGNPGREHVLDRHNLGFIAVESWVLLKGEEFRKQEFHSEMARIKVGGEDVVVLKPLTYMNRSGEAIQEAMHFLKIPIDDVIVVHDEIDIPPKTFRLKRGGGHGGHNGLRSIVPFGENFVRIRMGVGRPPHPGMDVADYVLGKLSKEELDFWQDNMRDVESAIDLSLLGQWEKAATKYNRKNGSEN